MTAECSPSGDVRVWFLQRTRAPAIRCAGVSVAMPSLPRRCHQPQAAHQLGSAGQRLRNGTRIEKPSRSTCFRPMAHGPRSVEGEADAVMDLPRRTKMGLL